MAAAALVCLEGAALGGQQPPELLCVHDSLFHSSVEVHKDVEFGTSLRFACNSLVCGRKPSDPHHLRYVQPRALGRKASDEFAVPLCRVHHRAAHRASDEHAWWKAAGIDPIKIARRLWKQTRVKEGRLPADQIMQTPQSSLALNSQRIGSAGRDVG